MSDKITPDDRKWIDLHNSLPGRTRISDVDYLWMKANFSDTDWTSLVEGLDWN